MTGWRGWPAALALTWNLACAGEVSMVFVGDVMLDQGPGRVIAQGGDPFRDFAPMLQSADLAVANLELPITRGGKKSDKVYTFRADPGVTPLLARYFSALTVANNHSGDYGRAAFRETLEHLKEYAIPWFGGGLNLTEAHQPLIIERKGLRIALLGYNEFKPRTFEATADLPGIAWSEDDQVVRDIRAVRDQADLVIPVMHWGWEREPVASGRQRRLGRLLIDAGADLVVGGHPHVTQDVEYYRDRLILYSLGNFVFDGFISPEAKLGWLLQVDLDAGGLVRWRTVAARMDESGVPHPVPGATTPCGQRGDVTPQSCAHP